MNTYTLSAIFAISMALGVGESAAQVSQSPKSGRIDPAKYTIYIMNHGKASDSDSLLELHNNSIFRIRIPVACCEKRGQTVREILPLFRVDRISGTVDIPNLNEDLTDGHWLAPGDSIGFRVPARYSRAEHTVYVPFNYEWELDGLGPKSGVGEPEHYVISILGSDQATHLRK
jgi:hypothetical protein